MKPLPWLHLTNEDEVIWVDVIDRTARNTALGAGLSSMFSVSEESDRRDAELMREAQSFSDFAKRCHGRTVFTVLNPPDMGAMPLIGGVQVGGRQLDITDYA